MNYYEALRRQREAVGLTQEEAAEKLHISVRGYGDRENNRRSLNIPERFGLLVGLGMEADRAMKVALSPDSYSFGGPELKAQMETAIADPFVKETKKAFILVDRNHDFHEYEILKNRVQSPNDILGWVDHLSDKNWVTTEHLQLFIRLASKNLGLSIHPV